MNQSFEQSSGCSRARAVLRQAIVVAALFRELAVAAGGDAPAGQVAQPRIAGDWWQIAGAPDLGELTATNQQPVDFAIWQAADGAWQLWSCIRRTKEAGNTRLFHRWESASLTDSHWKPMGIALRADATFGEKPGGLQAPFVFRDAGRFVMFCGGSGDICSASGTEGELVGLEFEGDGKGTVFCEGSWN